MLISESLRKKGGIIIKKIKFFLMIIFAMFLINNINVHAETAYFYEADYIDGIYMNKYQQSTQTIFYQKARFFRKTDTNEYAYCIEPFNFFNETSTYESTVNPRNLSSEQIDRISKIAYFGYGYDNHRAIKWYPITQFMIWQAADPSGDYYFTDSLNGNRVDYFQEEMNEINNLIAEYDKLPSMANKEYKIVEGWNFTLEDDNKVLKKYKTFDKFITHKENNITLNSLKEGEYNYTFNRYENRHDKPIIFYQAKDSQSLVKTGDLNRKEFSFKVKVVKTSLELTKIDKDTKNKTPSGEAILNGAKYTLYNDKMKKLKDIEIKNNKAKLENLYFGKYYLKETTAGTGYTLDNKTYEINITDKNYNISLKLENEVIKKEIIIEKKFGDGFTFHNEQDIEFEIYNKKNKLIKTIKTNDKGIASIILPYGEYKIVQKNTTEGYEILKPFTIKVLTNKPETIELKDYKIPVPNTYVDEKNNFLAIIIQILILIIC